jgi:LysM repeat protein
MNTMIQHQTLITKLCLGLLLITIFALEFDINIISANSTTTYWHEKTYNEVRVYSGDSVWSIASNFATSKDDIRELVTAIKRVNSLSNRAEIYPGQVLKVPSKINADPSLETKMAVTAK